MFNGVSGLPILFSAGVEFVIHLGRFNTRKTDSTHVVEKLVEFTWNYFTQDTVRDVGRVSELRNLTKTVIVFSILIYAEQFWRKFNKCRVKYGV
jgi:hypothetical protein